MTMVKYLESILTEYEAQLDNATSEDEENFWRGAVFAIKISITTAESYGA